MSAMRLGRLVMVLSLLAAACNSGESADSVSTSAPVATSTPSSTSEAVVATSTTVHVEDSVNYELYGVKICKQDEMVLISESAKTSRNNESTVTVVDIRVVLRNESGVPCARPTSWNVSVLRSDGSVAHSEWTHEDCFEDVGCMTLGPTQTVGATTSMGFRVPAGMYTVSVSAGGTLAFASDGLRIPRAQPANYLYDFTFEVAGD